MNEPDAFFHDSIMTRSKTLPMFAKCGSCGLYKHCKSPKMELSGSGRKGVMIVGEAPGKDEDDRGIQFIGKTGQFLQKHLRYLGVDLRRDCWSHNALSCRPGPDNKIKDTQAVEWCRPRVIDSINKHDPSVIILLGRTAVASVLGHLWKEDVGGSKRWAGFQIPCRQPNAWIACTYHPSFVNREKQDAELYGRVFQSHLKAAFDKAGTRPWKEIPDETKEVESLSPADAAAVMRQWSKQDGLLCFDFETDRLKPDHPDKRIVACGICWQGKRTIAFPWRGEGPIAFKGLMNAPNVKKMAWNLIFERRWARRALGTKGQGWHFDPMQAAHVLDCRPSIAGLKFQAFVRLGVADYDGRIKPYLEGKEPGGNSPNRINEVDMKSLLLYVGLDALLAYRIALVQMRELGWTATD